MIRLKEIKTVEEWKTLLLKSETQGIYILKHSTRCSISAKAYQEVITYLEESPNTNIDYWVIKVIESRPISNEIANTLGVKHESPQAILMRNQKSLWNSSHFLLPYLSLFNLNSLIRKTLLAHPSFK
jgi:bacillithiol system protein YtxJ